MGLYEKMAWMIIFSNMEMYFVLIKTEQLDCIKNKIWEHP
jgi:hypothetical protein